MYIPLWLLILIGVIVFLVYRSKKRDGRELSGDKISVEDIEANVKFQKKMLFSLEHFDSPHFLDLQNAFDAMELNYLRLKQRFFHMPEKILEIAKDWVIYVGALGDLKHARVMLDVDMGDEAFDNIEERSKEPSIIKEEVEKKFKSILGDDWQEIPVDYFQRMETIKEPDKATIEKLGLENEWKYYYRDSINLHRLEEKRHKKEK